METMGIIALVFMIVVVVQLRRISANIGITIDNLNIIIDNQAEIAGKKNKVESEEKKNKEIIRSIS